MVSQRLPLNENEAFSHEEKTETANRRCKAPPVMPRVLTIPQTRVTSRCSLRHTLDNTMLTRVSSLSISHLYGLEHFLEKPSPLIRGFLAHVLRFLLFCSAVLLRSVARCLVGVLPGVSE